MSNIIEFRAACESRNMDTLELLDFVDKFRWFPRTHPHCAETYAGRNLKKYGYKGFFEIGTTYNMDIVYAYVEEHDLGLNAFLKELDELVRITDEWREAVERAELEEHFWVDNSDEH